MKHPHAELMAEYAKDAMTTDKPWELWEYYLRGHWYDLGGPPSWNSSTYRRKTVKSDLEKYGIQVGDVWRVKDRIGTYFVERIGIHEVIVCALSKSVHPSVLKTEFEELIFRRGEVNKL